MLCLCAGVVLMSCNKDDDDDVPPANMVEGNQITAVVENGSSYDQVVDVVKALIDFDEDYDGSNYWWIGQTVASGNYTNGGFTLNLPATVDDQYLYNATDYFEGAKISDAGLKIGDIVFQGYKSGDPVDEFRYYYGNENTSIDGWYIYADRDATIKLSDTYTENSYTYNDLYSISVKQGWNLLYDIYTSSGNTRTWEVTSAVQSGLKWYYGSDLYIHSLSSKNVSKQRSSLKLSN